MTDTPKQQTVPTPAEIQALRGTVETNGAAPMGEKSFPNVTSWSQGGPVPQKILCNSQGPDFLKAVVDRLLEERDAGYNHNR